MISRWFGRENEENVVRTRDWCGWPSSPRPIKLLFGHFFSVHAVKAAYAPQLPPERTERISTCTDREPGLENMSRNSLKCSLFSLGVVYKPFLRTQNKQINDTFVQDRPCSVSIYQTTRKKHLTLCIIRKKIVNFCPYWTFWDKRMLFLKNFICSTSEFFYNIIYVNKATHFYNIIYVNKATHFYFCFPDYSLKSQFRAIKDLKWCGTPCRFSLLSNVL